MIIGEYAQIPTLSPDAKIWLKNINAKCREISVLLNTYNDESVNIALYHLNVAASFAKEFIKKYDNRPAGE